MGARAVAIAAGEKTYFTGKSCKNGHIALRRVESKGCIECLRASYAKWEAKNQSARNAYKAELRKANPERTAEASKRSRLKHIDRVRAKSKEYYAANRGVFIAANKARKKAIAQQTPPWADMKAIREIYRKAAKLSDVTGIEYHVDHDIPLRGKKVCGLHVETNLVILTRQENMAKYNKWPV